MSAMALDPILSPQVQLLPLPDQYYADTLSIPSSQYTYKETL